MSNTNTTVDPSFEVVTTSPGDADLGEKVAVAKTSADNLSAQVSRVDITSNEVFASAGDLMKIINSQLKTHEAARTALVKPLNDHVKFINDQFRPHTAALTGAKTDLKVKMDEWARKEAARVAEEEAAARREAEERAMRVAQAAEAAGESDLADEILDRAADEPQKRTNVVARGSLGSSSSFRKTWDFEVEDIKTLCRAVADGKLPVEAVMANETFIRNEVRTWKGDTAIPGVRVFQDVKSQVR